MGKTEHLNEVRLVGRVSAAPRERELPSGDVLASWRVVVDRPPGGRSRVRIDALECVTFRDAVREAVAGWAEGAVVEVRGALRRRFWRSGGGPASRYEVEAETVSLIAAPGESPATGGRGRRWRLRRG